MKQREIKFRQYLGKGRWHYWGFTRLGEFTAPVQVDNIPSQQYTGLENKNGKEIYEGDILEASMSDLVDLNEKFVVEYVNGFYARFRQYDESKVIGNICENPELLT